MSWQACPVCQGTGYDPFGGCHNTAYPSCRHCDGKRIIDEQTGYAQNPPSSQCIPDMPELAPKSSSKSILGISPLTPAGVIFRDKLYAILRAFNNHIIDGNYGEQMSLDEAYRAIFDIFEEYFEKHF